ncbi:MAG: bifunctional 2-polyprenyl-6-hydroxyphenol methylase/3-demethylubiquinol 3-O-methyltransferase UbiG [Gammaproteobacteria bacterium]
MHANVDQHEVEKFDALAARWWDSNGPFRPLHDLNPARLQFVTSCASLANCKVIDIGCGGGILSEAMARAGAHVTGIDASPAAIDIARLHAEHDRLTIDYRCENAEKTAQSEAASYDLVTCMELLEHVPDPCALIQTCATLAKPGGSVVLSTLNRTASAYFFGVLGAEYLLKLLPRGTHEYQRFIKPSELASWVRNAGLSVEQLRGLTYNPLTRHARLTSSVSINYLMQCRRPGNH